MNEKDPLSISEPGLGAAGQSPDPDPAEVKPFGLSAPWYLYVRQVRALFGRDPAVSIEYVDAHKELTLYVIGEAKAEAIGLLLPKEKVFGSVVLKIDVVPANTMGLTTNDIFKRAFDGNPAFKFVETCKPDGCSIPFNFVVFDNKVVQMWTDNLCDINGLDSKLYQDIANEVLDTPPGTYYCTEKGSDVIRD